MSHNTLDHGVRTWRASLAARIVLVAVLVFWLLVGAIIVVGVGPGWWPRLIEALVFAVPVSAVWSQFLHPRLIADDEGLLIIGARHDGRGAWSDFGGPLASADREPVRIPWAAVDTCTPSPEGLWITREDGRQWLARFPQKAPMLFLFKRKKFAADRAVDEILTRAGAARARNGTVATRAA